MGFAAPYQRVAIHRLNSSVYVTGSQFRARQYSRDYWLMVAMVIFHYLWGEPRAVFVAGGRKRMIAHLYWLI